MESSIFKSYIEAGRKFLIYDVETTGLRRKEDRIVEYSAIIMEKVGQVYKMTDSIEQYIRPRFEMKEEVVAVHGITNDFLKDYPYEEDAYPAIKSFLDKHKDAVICGYNQKRFDDAMVYNMRVRQNDENSLEHPEEEIDVYTLVKENIYSKNRKLEEVFKEMYPDSELHFHNSSDDIKATWEVAKGIYCKMYKELSVEKKTVTPCYCRYFSKSAKVSMLMVIVKMPNGEFRELRYHHYYSLWKSKEEDVDINKINIPLLEEALNNKFGDFKKVRETKSVRV